MMRTMLTLRLSGYGRETKRPAIGYGQRPENSQRADGWAEVWADGWAEGEGEYVFSSLLKQKIKAKNCAVFCFAGKRKIYFIYL